VITQQQIETLPLAARQPVGLALLMPGTSQDGVRPRKFNVNVGAGGFAHGSALIIDGIWNKDGNTGRPRMDLPQPAIREFKVFVSQAPAECGWTAGGVISFQTKSGTNLFSGEAYEFFRDKSLNAMNRFEQERHELNGTPKPAYRRHQFGGAFGGPVVRDRVHFFVTAERTKTNVFATVTTGRPDLYSSVEGTFRLPEYSNMVSTRGDVQLSASQTVFARYAWQQSDTSCETCGGRTALAAGSGLLQPRKSLVAGHTWVVSSRILNEVRGQVTNVILPTARWWRRSTPGAGRTISRRSRSRSSTAAGTMPSTCGPARRGRRVATGGSSWSVRSSTSSARIISTPPATAPTRCPRRSGGSSRYSTVSKRKSRYGSRSSGSRRVEREQELS
jgi:hypothetical protein